MSKIRVLLVDDEVNFRASLEKVLSHRGFDAKVAAEGLTALSLIGKERFDVVILDIKMPGMDGVQVLSEIQRLSLDVPVTVLTGHYSSAREENIFRKSAYAYLLKPYPIMDLVHVIIATTSDKTVRSK